MHSLLLLLLLCVTPIAGMQCSSSLLTAFLRLPHLGACPVLPYHMLLRRSIKLLPSIVLKIIAQCTQAGANALTALQSSQIWSV